MTIHDARREALEESARLLDVEAKRWRAPCHEDGWESRRQYAAEFAAAIRALARRHETFFEK
jgi:hypothetical protein